MKQLEIVRGYFFLAAMILMLAGCDKSIDLSPHHVRWDQDVCARCAMHLSDPLNSAQVIDKRNGNAYYFDDLGCAVLWLREGKAPFDEEGAVIYINDAKDGKWLKHNEAIYASPYITPMSFGIAAFADKNNIAADKTILTYEKAVAEIIQIRDQRKHNNQGKQGHHMSSERNDMEDGNAETPVENATENTMENIKKDAAQ